jgi:glycosyltransferase involved in cell wall biosynthesis
MPLVHGVAREWIVREPLYEPDELPVDVRSVRRPVLGYFGSLGNVDFVLLDRLAVEVPEGSLLIVGPSPRVVAREQEVAFKRLRARRNVLFAGPRPRSAAVQYMRAFDVCLVPYRLTEMVQVANPSKLRDYLATSRPVVSTWFPDVELFADCIEIGHDRDEFVERVRRLLAVGCQDGKYEARLRVAREHTWEKAAERLWLRMEPLMRVERGSIDGRS